MAYKNGLTTAAHDAMRVDDYFKIVYDKVEAHKGALIVDVFSGGGRDIKNLYDRLGKQGRFVAIDADPLRVADMLGKENFVQAKEAGALSAIFQKASIAVIQGTFPDRPYGDMGTELEGKVGFVLCNAGIMSVKPSELQSTLQAMSRMLAPKGELILRFSQSREDQAENEGKKYFVHSPSHVEDILQQMGLDVKRSADLPDPAGRPFHWVDLHARKF
jgi:SAM-dependent methyltransferase